jgi:hypothetical protein
MTKLLGIGLALALVAPAYAAGQPGMLRHGSINYASEPRDGTYAGLTIGVRACPAAQWARYGCTWRGLDGRHYRFGRRGDITILIPTHDRAGRPLSDAEAIAEWQRTRRDFGTFANLQAAAASARLQAKGGAH